MIVREPIVGWRQWKFMYPHFLANLGNDTISIVRSSAIPSDSGAHQQSSRWLAGLVMSMACHAK